MNRYGYYGDLPGAPRQRIRPYSQATGLGVVTPTDVRRPVSRMKAIKSGSYVGAPGRRVAAKVSSRDFDTNYLRGLGMMPAGPAHDDDIRAYLARRDYGGPVGVVGLGSARDRDICRTLAQLGSDIIEALLAGQRPTRRAGESATQYQARLDQFTRAQTILGSSSSSGTLDAMVNLCNLIEVAEAQSTPSSGSSAADQLLAQQQAAAARQQLERLVTSNQGMSTGTMVALGLGVAGAIGAAIYLLR